MFTRSQQTSVNSTHMREVEYLMHYFSKHVAMYLVLHFIHSSNVLDKRKPIDTKRANAQFHYRRKRTTVSEAAHPGTHP